NSRGRGEPLASSPRGQADARPGPEFVAPSLHSWRSPGLDGRTRRNPGVGHLNRRGQIAGLTKKTRGLSGFAPRQNHDSDDSLVVERQARCEVTLIRHFAGFTPASDLMRPGNDVALDLLELRLRLLHRELLVSARLLKHLPACCDATKAAARRH